MNNKETLQNHNTRISNKNTELKDILNTIDTLPTRPKGILDITENGIHNVANYAIANVDVLIDTSIEDGLLDNSLTGAYTNNRINFVDGHKFRNSKITAFNSTSVKKIGSYSFGYSAFLQECNTPNLEDLSAGDAFISCTLLKKVYFPKLGGTMASATFQGCTNLAYAHLGNLNIIGTGAFSNCTNLTTLILPRTSVTTLNAVTTFNNTPIANGTGYVYVPDDLVESYKTATNWSTYASQIKGLSELSQEV